MEALTGRSFGQISSAVGSNDNTVGAVIDASAAQLVRYLCSVTATQPVRVCSVVGAP